MDSLPHHDPPQTCKNPLCFFCSMNEQTPSLRTIKLTRFFKELPSTDDQNHVLALSSLFNLAINQPDDPEFPCLGIFDCMSKLIQKALNDKHWVGRHQNVYIPYYAAHIIGSYTMNRADFAEKAVQSGVVSCLIEVLRGELSWVEQRVAIRALGHIASHERTFEDVALYGDEVIELVKTIACESFRVVYKEFVGVKQRKRVKYQCDLITRGVGGLETENRKAEEWASQLQCWSLFLLNCFVKKQRLMSLICEQSFLIRVCKMWGGLANPSSPAGVGLIRALCYTKIGRQSVGNVKEVIESLCNMSRSSDDWQYMAIDSLLLLLKDPGTRHKVMDLSADFLGDLVEVNSLKGRNRVGEAITQTVLQDFHKIKYGKVKLKSEKTEKALEEIWDLKVERRKKEKLMCEEELLERKVTVGKLKQQGNEKFWSGSIEEAVKIYTKGLDLCPLNMVKERVVLYSNRSQCYLLLNMPESAVSDTTRALCLSGEVTPHSKSLWRRSQAYDMLGLEKESLMDCLTFVGSRMKSKHTKRVKIPYYAAVMINKQMSATWPFKEAKSPVKLEKIVPGMPTIIEEHLIEKSGKKRNGERGRRRKSIKSHRWTWTNAYQD